ncbi:Crotonase superfamily, partial [Parasponia andersonii]
LNPAVIDSLLSVLSQLKSQATRGSALITTAQPTRFFSTGFDLDCARSADSESSVIDRLQQLVASFKLVVAELISLPVPTIVALPGHAFAAGFLLALSHDYIVMRRHRGVVAMSEVDLGLAFPNYFAAAMRSKIGCASARRDVMLRVAMIRGDEAVRLGIAESAHDSAESALEAAVRLGDELGQRKWDGVVYTEIRKSMLPDLCAVLGVSDSVITPKL